MGAEIFQGFLQPPKSVMDYENEMADADARRQNNALRAMAMRQQVDTRNQAMASQNALRRLAAGWGAGTSDDQRIADLQNSGDPTLIGQADAMRKTAIERAKAEAAAAKDRADAGKTTNETLDGALKRYRSFLDYVDTPQAAARWVQAQHADPVVGPFVARMGSADEMAQRIPTDPAAFQQWRQAQAIGMEKVLEMQQKDRDFRLKANNELIGPDGQVNQALLGAKKDIATAGKISVSVNTGQHGFDNTLKLRGDFRSEPVYKAHQEMQSAYSQIQQSLKQGSPIGDTAAATKIMKLLDPGSVVRESELGMAMAATGMLDRVTNYAQNVLNGTKLTPQQRKDFQALADSLYGESAKLYNAKRGEYEGIATRNSLNVADVLGSPSAAPQPVAPAAIKPGTVLKFDANGKPIP
jgi:hypothetical protein